MKQCRLLANVLLNTQWWTTNWYNDFSLYYTHESYNFRSLSLAMHARKKSMNYALIDIFTHKFWNNIFLGFSFGIAYGVINIPFLLRVVCMPCRLVLVRVRRMYEVSICFYSGCFSCIRNLAPIECVPIRLSFRVRIHRHHHRITYMCAFMSRQQQHPFFCYR